MHCVKIRTLKLAFSTTNAREITNDHYNERTNIIKNVSLFRSIDVSKYSIVKLNTNCNTAYFLPYLLKDVPKLEKDSAAPALTSM